MKKTLFSCLVALFLCTAGRALAAPGGVEPDSGAVTFATGFYTTTLQDPGLPGKHKVSYLKNNVKINLSSLLLNNYSLSYERSLTKKISFVAGYRFMPETTIGSLGLTKKLVENLDVDADVRSNLDSFRSSNKAYTGEIRFYSGRKPGARGLYVSLYGRYTDMRYDLDLRANYDGKDYNIPVRSEVAGYGGGLMLGSQWLIAKRLVLDLYIIGGHYGKITRGSANAITDLSDLSAEDKRDIEERLEDIGTVGSTRYIEAEVTNSGARAKIDGPFLGVRGLGFSLGVAF